MSMIFSTMASKFEIYKYHRVITFKNENRILEKENCQKKNVSIIFAIRCAWHGCLRTGCYSIFLIIIYKFNSYT